MSEAKKRVKLLTPMGRLCFPAIFEKEQRQVEGANTPPKYVATLVFDKAYLKANKDEMARYTAMRQAADASCVEKFKKPIKDIKFSNFRDPFRDGAEKEHLDGFGEGTLYVKFSSKQRPGVVASDAKTPLDDPEALYPGCYVRISTNPYAYDNRSKGVAFSLNNVMFVKDGPRLDFRSDPEEDFGELAGVTDGDSSDDIL